MYQSRIRANRKKTIKKREFIEPTEGQEYGIVQDMLGNGRCRVFCQDKVARVGRIRGSMRKYAGKVIIERGDLVLVAPRDYEPDKLDLIHKYTHEEVSELIRRRELPDVIMKVLHADFDEDGDNKKGDDYVMFVEGEFEDEAGGSEDGKEDDDGEESDIDIDAI